MQCLFIGFTAVLYTLFVYYDVLLKADQDWIWILIIFCLTWTGVYLVKRFIDRSSYRNLCIRHTTMITTASCIISIVARSSQNHLRELTKQCDSSTDTTVFFAANVFFAVYFLLMRQANECMWSIESQRKLKALRFLAIVTFASGSIGEKFDECVMDQNAYIFHQIIFSIMIGCSGFNMFSVMMANLELEDDFEKEAAAAALIEVVDEEISPPTEVKNAAERVVSEKETVQG